MYVARRTGRFNPQRFMLSYNSSSLLSVRAQFANISGEARVFSERESKFPIATLAAFCIERAKEEVSVHRFLNPLRGPLGHSRPANRDECVAFVGSYPQEARKGRLVCMNTGLFFGDDYPTMVAFEWERDHFTAQVLPDSPRILAAGDIVLFMK